MSNVINFRHITRTFSISVFLLLSGVYTLSAQEKIFGEEVLYMEGLKEYKIGSADKALSIFSSLARKGSKNDAVYYYLSNIYSYKK